MQVARRHEIAPERLNHVEPRQLERFMRGELPRVEVRDVVRHLLTGCSLCMQVTRRLWTQRVVPPLNPEERES